MDATFNAAYSVSGNGTLVVHSGGLAASSMVTWYDRGGKPVGPLATDNFNVIRLSPDARRVAASVYDNSGGEDIWLFDVARGVRTRFTFDPALDDDPVWSPDGSSLVFDSNRTGAYGIYQKLSNGAQKEELVFTDPATKFPSSWSHDGKYVLFDRVDPQHKLKTDVWVLPMFGDHKAFPLISTEFNEQYGEFSPDGRWVAYDSNESGREEVYVVAFPNPAARFQISTGGGSNPMWRGDSKELFYVDPDNKIMAVDIAARSDSLEIGTPHVLWQPRLTNTSPPYAVAADGKRFLVNELPSQSTSHLTVIFNWDADLKK
jgi:Tol biopolymer transport system component